MPPFKFKYQERIVAYVDILGFRNLIMRSEGNLSAIQIIYKSLQLLKGQEKSDKWNMNLVEIEESAQYKGIKNFDITNKVNCTCFSDNIVISVKVEAGNINEMITTLICNLAAIGALLINDGILVRGAITIGKIIHEENGVIMGPALINAYELESKVANYPRIILSDALLSKMNYPITEKRNSYPYHQYIERFSDGCVGFHQLIYYEVIQPWEKVTAEEIREDLGKAKQTIIKGLDESFEHPDIYQKYQWLKERYNDLIIFEDGAKEKIPEISDVDARNIHYSFADEFNPNRKQNK